MPDDEPQRRREPRPAAGRLARTRMAIASSLHFRGLAEPLVLLDAGDA